MANREIEKQKFKTIETDELEYEDKIRQHRRKRMTIVLTIIALLALLVGGVFLYMHLREYTEYDVISSKERTDTTAATYVSFQNGIIKYSNDGVSYVNQADELVWNQTYEMQNPLIDICERYVVLAEQGGKQIYIMNDSENVGEIETTMEIVKVSVASQGTMAVLMRNEGKNYIHIYDKEGTELAGGQIGVENTGYPLDIALSNDGIKLGVSMVDVNDGSLGSLIAFYNFGSVGQNEIDNMVGTCSYSNLVVPQIDFVSEDRMLAFGDSRILIFEGTQKPTLAKEIVLEKEINNYFFNKNYFGYAYNNGDEDNTRHFELYDTKGSHVLSKDFEMDYDTIEILANNEICVRNETQCMIYNTYGVKHFASEFDKRLCQILSGEASRFYTFIVEGEIEEVRLR